jgi:cullin 3
MSQKLQEIFNRIYEAATEVKPLCPGNFLVEIDKAKAIRVPFRQVQATTSTQPPPKTLDEIIASYAFPSQTEIKHTDEKVTIFFPIELFATKAVSSPAIITNLQQDLRRDAVTCSFPIKDEFREMWLDLNQICQEKKQSSEVWKALNNFLSSKLPTYTTLDNYAKEVKKYRQVAQYLYSVLGYFHGISIPENNNKKGEQWCEPRELALLILAREFVSFESRVFNDLSALIIADQKQRQINHSIIIEMLALFKDYKNDNFQEVYISGCDWYSEWTRQQLEAGVSAAMVAAVPMIAHVEECVDSYNTFQTVTADLLTNKVTKPIYERVVEGFAGMLDNNRQTDLENCCKLFKRIEPELVTLGQKIIKHIADNTSDHAVPALIEKHKYYKKLVVLFPVTYRYAGFQQVLLKIDRFVETFSIYLDSLFRQKMSEDEFEKTFTDAIDFSNYIQDRDIFQRYYTVHFGRRMLAGANIELERTALGIIKQSYGLNFVHGMEAMFKDIEMAKDLTAEFPQKGLVVKALASNFWPKSSPINIPKVLIGRVDEFVKFYLRKFSARKLCFIASGTAEVAFGKFVLNVSTAQMCILMAVGDSSDTVDKLSGTTGLPEKEVVRHLTALCHAKHPILLQKDGIYTVNDGFKSKTRVVKVGTMAAQKETAEEKKETDQSIIRSRELMLDAAIVRFMKARKTSNYNDIVINTTTECKKFYNPSPADIKKRLESLIEREFLERDNDNPKQFTYLA